MCKVQMLRALVKQRLTAAAEEIFGLFERTIAEYEEELSRSKEENERQRKLLDAVFNPQLRLHRADVQQILVVKEEVPSSSVDQEDPEPSYIKEDQEYKEPPHTKEDQEDPKPPHTKEVQEDPKPPHTKEDQEDPEPPYIKEDQEDPEPPHIKEDQEDPEPPHIKEEQEELWSSQEGEQLQGLEEADITKFPFTPVPVKSEDDEEKPQSSQLHQRLTEQMETEADGEDCGGPEPDRDSHPDTNVQPDIKDDTRDSSETRVSGDNCKETREPQSGLNSLKKDKDPASKKPFSCSECGKRFGFKGNLKHHMMVHTGERPFSCSLCDKRFLRKLQLIQHMTHHTGEKPFGCNICYKRFAWRSQVNRHKCIARQSSQQTDQIKTEADGEDCGGSKPARNSHPDAHSQPDTEDKTGDSSEPETDDSNDWKETRESDDPSENDKLPVTDWRYYLDKKLPTCSECGKTFSNTTNLKVHMLIHKGDKPFGCIVCGKRFSEKARLTRHMKRHPGEKPFSCPICQKRYRHKGDVGRHMRQGCDFYRIYKNLQTNQPKNKTDVNHANT